MTPKIPYLAIKPTAWPTSFLRFIALRTDPEDPLTANRTSGWRSTTFRQYVNSIGHFLGWLRWSGRYRDDLDIVQFVSVSTVRAFVEDMRQFGLAPPTIANRIDGVRAALSALAPEQDTKWLMAGINRLRAQPSDRRRKHERVQHTADVVEVGMDLMRGAMEDEKSHPVFRAIRFRDGMILVFGALAVPRIGALRVMALGRHIAGSGESYRIAWSAAEMKAGQPYEARLGSDLSRLLDDYITRFRPILLARRLKSQGNEKQELWLSWSGRQLSYSSIYNIITQRTGAVFDKSIYPHALRHGAATTLAVERPDLIDIATPLLQHRDERSRGYYNLANGIAASTRFGDALRERRAASAQGRRLMRR